MKLIVAMLITRFIITLFTKDKPTQNITGTNKSETVIHPAEFKLRVDGYRSGCWF